ncbi:MAG: GAF domain-containing protein [Acidobacteriota bacterium]
MFDLSISSATPADEGERTKALPVALASLLEGETDALANLSNAASLIFASLNRINWAGFYLLRGDTLVLGPFQGKPACVRIPMGKGVCGAAAARRQTLVVPDVNAFPDHIACDAASRSEIVVPILDGDVLRGVLDVDSPEKGRFGDAEQAVLEECVRGLVPRVDWGKL